MAGFDSHTRCGIFAGGWSRGGNKHTNPYREPSSGVFGEKVAGFLPQRAFAARKSPSPCCRESFQQEGRIPLAAAGVCCDLWYTGMANMPVYKDRFVALRNYRRYSDGNLSAFARHIHDSMLGSSKFPRPTVSL